MDNVFHVFFTIDSGLIWHFLPKVFGFLFGRHKMFLCGLTTLKSYTIGNHVKFIGSIKYYQQPISNGARSTDPTEKKRISSLFLDYLGFQHLYYSTFFLQDLSEDDRTFVLDYLCLGKSCFPYEVVTGFNSLSVKPDDGDFWSIKTFYSRLRDEGISQKSGKGVRNYIKY